MTSRVSEKPMRLEILEEGKHSRWSFQQKLSLYVGICDSREDQERMLFGFNRLRNMIAHRFENEDGCLAKCLPWDGEFPRPDARAHVAVIASILFFDLGLLESIRRLNDESPHS